MIDYSPIVNILKSDNYVDRTNCFESFFRHCYVSLEGCAGTGSSLFLRTLACFLDKTTNTKDTFQNLKIKNSEHFSQEINSYRVVLLDFTDFNADSYEGAIEYVKEKMSLIYKHFYNDFEVQINRYFFDYRTLEDALDIIEKTATVDTLQKSLRNLLLQLRGYETYGNGRKLAVLIDNMVVLEIVAAENRYTDEMREFLKSFIVDDVYKYCDIFLQISDCKEKHNDPWLYREQYLVHRYFSASSVDLKDRYEEIIVAKECQRNFEYLAVVKDEENWDECIAKGRRKVQEAKEEEERQRQERISQEKIKYAKNLSPVIPPFSPNLGIRRKALNKTTPQYAKLNAFIKDVYMRFRPQFNSNSIYQFLQKLNTKERIIKNQKETETILKYLSARMPLWQEEGLTNCWSNWIQVLYTRKDNRGYVSPGRPQNIKVYAYLKSGDIQSVFVDSLRCLLENANDSFGAKVSVCSRSDQMCYWLSKSDFKHLENFFKPYFLDMVKSMPFVAYKGMLGISREFPGADDSHNATQSNIIADYLKTVSNIDDVDLENMYNHYIAKWNADIYEESDYCCFKRNTALSFIVLTDTLDAILNEKEVMEESLLLSDDGRIWHTLADSYCWADLNEKWEEWR